MKITVSVTKSLDQDCGLCYLHLPIFSLHTHTYTHTHTHTHTHTLLCCCKIKSSCAGPHKLCVQGYNHQCGMHASDVMHTWKSMCSIDSSMLKLFEFTNLSVFFFLPYAWMILSCSTSCEGHKLWKLNCPLVLSTCCNWELLFTDHYDLRK